MGTLLSAVIVFTVATLGKWGQDVRISVNDSISRAPLIEVDRKDKVHIFWVDDRNGKWDIYYSWWYKHLIGPEQNLTPDVMGASMSPAVTINGDTIHFVWMDNRDGNWEIYYKNSIDAGYSWSTPTRLTYNEAVLGLPVIKSNNGKIHVVWCNEINGYIQLYYKHSVNGGVSWSEVSCLTFENKNAIFPQLAISGEVLHLVYYKGTPQGIWEVYYKRSPNEGMSWEPEVKLASDGWAVMPSIVAKGNNVWVAWQDCREERFKIYYKRSVDKGASWEEEKKLTDEDDAHDLCPKITYSGNTLYVVWERYFYGDLDIWHAKSADFGETWEATDPLIENKEVNAISPYVKASGIYSYMVWRDRRDKNWEIYFKGFAPSWQIQLKALTNFSKDTLNYAGVEFDATDTFDLDYDIPEPPAPPSNYLQLYFPHPEWNQGVGDKFRTDICHSIDLSDTALIYGFEVKTDKPDEEINVEAIPFDVPDEYGIWLIDLEANIMQDMRAIPVYTYDSDIGGIHQFELWVGKPKRTLLAGWTQISVPVIPTDPDPATIFMDYVSPYWLYTYNQQGGYIEPDSVRNSYGYWMGVNEPCVIDAEGEEPTGMCEVPLELDWNLVGCPFHSSIWLDSVKVRKGTMTVDMQTAALLGWVQPTLYNYVSGANGYIQSELLSLWQGYWFAALKDSCTLLITKTPCKAKLPDGPPTPNNWALTIKAKSVNAADNITKLGVKEDATDGFDNQYDYFEPPIPPIDNWIQAYFERTEWECEFSEKFNQDIKAPIETEGTKSWTFDISPFTNGTVTLSWPGIGKLPTELSFILVDLASGTQVNMREEDSHQYTTDGTNHFRIDVKAGSEGAVQPSYPFALYQNKPNPFVGRTTISYSVAKKCKIELNLYDLSGRLVKTLVDKKVNPGYYTIPLDSKKFASGIYFVKFEVDNYKETKKLILIR